MVKPPLACLEFSGRQAAVLFSKHYGAMIRVLQHGVLKKLSGLSILWNKYKLEQHQQNH
jgi:hypothetical protein